MDDKNPNIKDFSHTQKSSIYDNAKDTAEKLAANVVSLCDFRNAQDPKNQMMGETPKPFAKEAQQEAEKEAQKAAAQEVSQMNEVEKAAELMRMKEAAAEERSVNTGAAVLGAGITIGLVLLAVAAVLTGGVLLPVVLGAAAALTGGATAMAVMEAKRCSSQVDELSDVIEGLDPKTKIDALCIKSKMDAILAKSDIQMPTNMKQSCGENATPTTSTKPSTVTTISK